MTRRLSKGDESIRRRKIIKASKTNDADSLPQLIAQLGAKESLANRRHAVRALGKIGGQIAQSKLLELLHSERGIILGDVAHSLGLLRNRAAVPELEKLVLHKNEWVRQNASFALKKIGAN